MPENLNKEDNPSKTEDGVTKVYPTHRPHGTTTFYTGKGDNLITGEVGGGNLLIFNLQSTDVKKTVDLQFSEAIFIKDGYIMFESAPLGSSIDIELVHPDTTVLGRFGKCIPLLGTGSLPLHSEDRTVIPSGIILRVTVNNSSGTGSELPAADFKVAGRLEVYRSNTI